MSEILLFAGGFVSGLLVGAIVAFIALVNWTSSIIKNVLDDLRKEGFIQVKK